MPYVLERFHGLEVIGQTQSEVPKPHAHVEGEIGAIQGTAGHAVVDLGHEFNAVGHLPSDTQTAIIGEAGRFHLLFGDGRMERRLGRVKRTSIIDREIN